MNRIGGSSLIILAIIMVLLGAVLRTGLIQWLINLTGFLLIGIGIILGIVGLVQMLSRNKGSSDY